MVGKTTEELRSIGTYTDFANDGIGYPLEGTGSVTADSEVWFEQILRVDATLTLEDVKESEDSEPVYFGVFKTE